MVKRPKHNRGEQTSMIDLIFTNIPQKVSSVRHIITGGAHNLIDVMRISKYIRKRAIIQTRSWKKYKDKKMKEEASKQKWNMFDNVEMPEELNEATPLFHKRINIVMDVVAPGQTIKLNPNYLGKWISPRLQQAIWDRNNESEQLNLKGKHATVE